VIYELQRLKLNLNQFNGVRDYILDLMKTETWSRFGYDDLENCRKTLRELMRYRGALINKPYLKLNVTDDGHKIERLKDEFSAPALNMDEYVKRVETALKNELQMQLVIYKIQKGEKLTEMDTHTVYQLFDAGRFDFTLEELAQNVHIKKADLDGLLRKFIGLDEFELNKRFELFIQAHPGISPTQIKILDMIKSDIIKNRGISFDILYKEPYTNINGQGIDGIFNGNLEHEVFSLIEPYKVLSVEYG
jgi:type I restriction enzyme R subunit